MRKKANVVKKRTGRRSPKQPTEQRKSLQAPSAPIEHVVVLMLENRSFDHMLGFLKQANPEINGLTGTESCPLDPHNPTSPVVTVTDQATLRGGLEIDPGHELQDVAMQLYGTKNSDFHVQPLNNGYVANYAEHLKNKDNNDPLAGSEQIMHCFNPEKLKVLATLAREYCLCDNWHSSMPGPTWPNRFFVHAGTSGGQTNNNMVLWKAQTVFQKLARGNHDWGIFFQDIPQSLAIRSLWKAFLSRKNFHFMPRFFEWAEAGKLPSYSFIEPQYFEFLPAQKKADDQHPPHDVINGEWLISDIYNALRASPKWESTLFVILYDEHGGTYDHQPPSTATPTESVSEEFDFSRLGVRVPAVLVSPYIAKNTVDHTLYDHTSLIATLGKILNVNTSSLSRRTREANTFQHNLSLPEPRTNTPKTITPFQETRQSLSRRRSLYAQPRPMLVQQALAQQQISAAPLNDLQRQLLQLAHELDQRETPEVKTLLHAQRINTEYDAAVYVRSRILKLTPTK